MGKLYLRIIFTVLFLTIIPIVQAVDAASLSFDPATFNTSVAQTFDVKVNVDAGADKITSVDAYILYDKNLLEPQSVTNGTYFPTVTKYISTDGKVYIAGMVDNLSSSKTGMGNIAMVTFKAKQSGIATLTFDCSSGSMTDSNIIKNDTNGTDIIACSTNGKSVLTIGVAGVTSIAPTSDSLPESGNFGNTVLFSALGIVLVLIGVMVRLILY